MTKYIISWRMPNDRFDPHKGEIRASRTVTTQDEVDFWKWDLRNKYAKDITVLEQVR